MARQSVESTSVTSVVRGQLNSNFVEVYSDISDLEADKVPYTGATGTVNLGAQKLITEEVESIGDLTIDCGSSKTLVLEEPVWEDLRFPVEQTKLGSNSLPHYDFTNNGLLFPQNDTSEVIYLVVQFPHSYKLGTDIYPHIHFIQSSANVPVFKLKYRWYLNGAAVPSFTTITSTTVVHTYTSGSILQRLAFPAISGAGITAISSMMDVQIYREDNVVTGDVLVKEFDIHYSLETVGSRSMISK